MLWRSPSASNLARRLTHMSIDGEVDDPNAYLDLDLGVNPSDTDVTRARSWPPAAQQAGAVYSAPCHK